MIRDTFGKAQECSSCEVLFHPVEPSPYCDGCPDALTEQKIPDGEGMCMQSMGAPGQCVSLDTVARIDGDNNPFTRQPLDDKFDSVRALLGTVQHTRPFMKILTAYRPMTFQYIEQLLDHCRDKKPREQVKHFLVILYLLWWRPVHTVLNVGFVLGKEKYSVGKELVTQLFHPVLVRKIQDCLNERVAPNVPPRVITWVRTMQDATQEEWDVVMDNESVQ
jgi:hypothetical protein